MKKKYLHSMSNGTCTKCGSKKETVSCLKRQIDQMARWSVYHTGQPELVLRKGATIPSVKDNINYISKLYGRKSKKNRD